MNEYIVQIIIVHVTKKMGCYLQVQGNSEDLHNPSMTVSIYDLVPKGVHQNRTKGVENKAHNRRSSEIQGGALGKCLQARPVYTGPCLQV